MLQVPWLASVTCLGETCLWFLLARLGCCTEGAVEMGQERVSTLAAALRRSLLGGFNKEEREGGEMRAENLPWKYIVNYEAAVKSKTQMTVKWNSESIGQGLSWINRKRSVRNKCTQDKTVHITGCWALDHTRHLLPLCVDSKSLPESEESSSASTLKSNMDEKKLVQRPHMISCTDLFNIDLMIMMIFFLLIATLT